MWETSVYPCFDDYVQAVINKQIGNDYDIFIGIMYKKFGTPTPKARSGTEEEFVLAYKKYRKNKKPEIMFYFNIEANKLNNLGAEFKKVESFKTKISNLGGFYFEYNGIKDFEEKIKNHFNIYFNKKYKKELITADIFRTIAEKQKLDLLKEHPSLEDGFSMEDLINKMYVEPQSNTEEAQLHSFLINKNFRNVLILGDGGVGKSTLLVKIYNELVLKYLDNNTNIYPIYISLKGKHLGNFNLKEIISNLISKYSMKKYISQLKIDCFSYFFIIDGLDEVQEIKDEVEITNFLDSDIFKISKVIVACRESFIKDNAIKFDFYDKIITLFDFSKKKQIEVFDKFFKYSNIGKNIIDDEKRLLIINFLNEKPEVVKNPLILSLFMLYIKDNEIPNNEINENQILNTCIVYAIKKQLSKQIQVKEVDDILKKISIIGWKIYLDRFYSEKIKYKDIKDNEGIFNRCLGLFISINKFTESIYIRNEKILEYFCAKYMLYVFTDEIKDEKELLFKQHIKVEITRIAFELMGESQKKVSYDYLINIYKKTNDDEYIKLQQLVNILPRINKKWTIEFLESEYNELKKCSNVNIKRAVVEHCMLQLGYKPELEEEYYNRMVDDPEFDSFVRGGYLVYYKTHEDNISILYHDDKKIDWKRVFIKAFKQHIEEDEKNDKRKIIRRLEFRIAKQYIEERKRVILEIAEFYKELPSESYNFNDNTRMEYYSLIETIKKYENI